MKKNVIYLSIWQRLLLVLPFIAILWVLVYFVN